MMRAFAYCVGSVALGFSLVGLTGCGSTASTMCTPNKCTVTLKGNDNHTEVEKYQTTVKYEGTSNGKATISLDRESGQCAANETLSLNGLTVTCTEVGDTSVKLTLTR